MNLFGFLSDKRPPLVEQSLATMTNMLAVAEEMFEASTGCLLDNESLTMDLGARDQIINEGEQTVRRNVLEHLTLDPTQEMVFSMLMLSIVQDAERCGDLCKSISKAAELAHEPRTGAHVASLRTIRDRVQAQFPIVRRSFRADDTEGARQVMDTHQALKGEVAGFLQSLADDASISPNLALVLGISARMIARTSSHLSNIISVVALPFDQVRNAPTWK